MLNRQQTRGQMRRSLSPTQTIFTMSDSDSSTKKPGVPSWQLQSKSADAKGEEQPAPESPSRDAAIEQARKFLEEDEVRDASTDKKIAFLESKGLQNDEIEKLLGVTRNTEASAPPLEVSSPSPPRPNLISCRPLQHLHNHHKHLLQLKPYNQHTHPSNATHLQ